MYLTRKSVVFPLTTLCMKSLVLYVTHIIEEYNNSDKPISKSRETFSEKNTLHKKGIKRKRRNSESYDLNLLENCFSIVPNKNKRKLPDDTNKNENKTKKIKLDNFNHKFQNLNSKNFVKKLPNEKIFPFKDDYFISHITNIDPVISIKIFLQIIPDSLYTKLAEFWLKTLNEYLYLGIIKKSSVIKTLEVVLCQKLLYFSTDYLSIFHHEYENIIFFKLNYCRRLQNLNITKSLNKSSSNFIKPFKVLTNLQTLVLIPENKYSFHWTFPLIANCKKLRELRILYNGDEICSSEEGIIKLESCQMIKKISLFNFGKKSETTHLTNLISKNNDIRFIFHKELPIALMNVLNNDEYSQNINSLCSKCNNIILPLETLYSSVKISAIGYQLIYYSEEHIYQIIKMCPYLIHLQLLNPQGLEHILDKLKYLKSLSIQQLDFEQCLLKSFIKEYSYGLTNLQLTDVLNLTQYHICLIAYRCPNLEVLRISNCNFKSIGKIEYPKDRIPFPLLRELMFRFTLSDDSSPLITVPKIWQPSKRTLKYLLKDSSQLKIIDIQFNLEEGGAIYEKIKELELTEMLFCKLKLESLKLTSPPITNYMLFLENLLKSCPKICTVSDPESWNVDEIQKKEIFKKYKFRLNIL